MILMILPEELLNAIQDLVVLDNLTGRPHANSQKSQRSVECSCKEDDPLDIKNYRSIALADTILMLYTSCREIYTLLSPVAATSCAPVRKALEGQKGTARQLLV